MMKEDSLLLLFRLIHVIYVIHGDIFPPCKTKTKKGSSLDTPGREEMCANMREQDGPEVTLLLDKAIDVSGEKN